MKVKKWLLGLVTFAAMVVLCVVCAGAETYGDFKYSVLDDGTVEITKYVGSAEKVDIPKTIDGKSVTGIGEYAFCNCTSFTSITIPDSVTSIGNDAFNGCTSLTSITIPSSVMSIRARTFKGCANLTSITIPDSVTSIGWSAFGDCASLTSITIPDSVTSIGIEAFYNCASITKVTIPDSVVSIGGLAFSDCTSLTSITIPDSVTIINGFTFFDCKSLNDVNIPDGVTYVGEGAFSGTAICNNQTEEVKYIDKWLVDSDNSVTDVAVKDGTVGISCGAFSYCGQLKNISIPNSVKYVGGKAFYNCISLTNVVLPYGITNIGASTFSGCESLASVTIPDSVTSIGEHAFFNTALLKNQTTTEKYVGKWVIDWDSDVKNVTIKNGTVGIADHAFERRTSLESITIPDSVEFIGVYAFLDCWKLKQVNMPESMTAIGDCAFYGCDSIDSVIVPKGVTQIGDRIFYGCASLTSVSIPDSVIDIQLNAFEKCVALNVINVDEMNKVYKSNSGVLLNKNETELILYPAGKKETTYNIPDGVVTINRSAFENVSALESIIIPNSVVNIERFAIYNCKLLKSVSIPLSVKNIGEYALGYYQGDHFETSKISNFKIECYAKTIGEQYAFDNGFEYTLIGHTHNFNGWVIVKEPTCTENGINTRSCDGCLKVETKTINALGHDYSTAWTTDKAATCGAAGSKSHHCTRCSAKANVSAIPATGNHKFGEWRITKAATYTATGTKTRICTVCKKTETATIAKLTLAKVTSFKVKSIFSTNVTLQWNKNTSASGYEIEQYKGGKWTNVAKITGNATTSYTIKGLKAGTAGYQFRIRAYRAEGKNKAYSGYSSIVKVNTNPYGVSGFKCSSKTSTSVTLKWNKGTTASGYQLQQYKGGKWVTIYTANKATVTSYTVKNLKAGTAGYRFRIRAYKTYGSTKQYGSWSSEVKVNTNPYGVGGFKAKSTAKTSITLGWNKGTTASGYQLQQYKGGKWVTVYTGTKATSTSCTVKNLKKNTSYKFRIRAYKTYGNTKQYGSWSKELTVKTKR